MPPAADTMCCSAMPHSMKRSGSSALNASMPQSDSRSASSTTMSGRVRAICEQLVAVRDHEPLRLRRRDADGQRRRRQRQRRLHRALTSGRSTRAADLADRGQIVLQRRRAGVEVVRLVAAREPFHERHAFALDRVGDEHLRRSATVAKRANTSRMRAKVVAVGAPRLPSRRRGTCPRSARDR